MKKDGLIRENVVSIDLSKLGYQGKAFLMITNASNYEKTVTISALSKIRNVIMVGEIIGPCDILAIAPIIDLESVRILINEIRALPSVQRVELACIDDTAFPVNESFGKILSEKVVIK